MSGEWHLIQIGDNHGGLGNDDKNITLSVRWKMEEDLDRNTRRE